MSDRLPFLRAPWRHPWRLAAVLLGAYVLASFLVAGVVIGAHHRPERRTPADHGVPFTAHTLVTEDGVELRAWLVEPVPDEPAGADGPRAEDGRDDDRRDSDADAEAPRRRGAGGTVLVFHGIGGDRPARYLAVLAQAGFRALAIDHRAHGRSGGDTCSFGWHERLDVEAATAFVRARWPDEPSGAIGLSMGAAALSVAPSTREFEAVVLESVYADIDAAYQTRMDLYVPGWLHPFAWLARQFVELRLGASAEDLSPERRLPELDPSRVLMLRGAEDRLVSVGEYERLRAALPDARWIVVDGLGHRYGLPSAGPAYRRELVAFLDERLTSAGRAATPDTDAVAAPAR